MESAVLRHHREQDQHIEKERRLELIVVGVADLESRAAASSARGARSSEREPGPRLIARKRKNCIQNSSTKVSATCANTGISMACIDIEASHCPLTAGQPGGLQRSYTLDFRQE